MSTSNYKADALRAKEKLGEVSKTMEVMRKNIEANLKDVYQAIDANKDSFAVNDVDQLSYELSFNKI